MSTPSLHDERGGVEALYFFYKPQVQVPLDFSNNTILNLLKNSGIGFGGRENHQFIMAADFITKAVISHLFYAYAQVYIDEGLPEPAVTKAVTVKIYQYGKLCSLVPGQQRVPVVLSAHLSGA